MSQTSHSQSHRSLFRLVSPVLACSAAGVLLLAGTVVYVARPHRTRKIELHTILQSGMKMDVIFSVHGSWGWQPPSQVGDVKVKFNGKSAPVTREICQNLRPLEWKQMPVIAETKGFPEIIISQRNAKQTPNVIRLRFQNYSFSEMKVVKGKDTTVKDYASPLPPSLTRAALPPPTPSAIEIRPDQIQPITQAQ